MCVGVSMLNLTGCVWRLCPTPSPTPSHHLPRQTFPVFLKNREKCPTEAVSHFCKAVLPLDTPLCPSPGDDSTKPSQDFSQAKFDMSSFIGGIILVLSLQAGGFFAMRFMKSKEQSSYDPM
uniref:CD164 sialomucin-like 2 n=1 Tax=Nothobranchius furzeri TaxID=105023 RepID=A0A8C6PS27_NOTFU